LPFCDNLSVVVALFVGFQFNNSIPSSSSRVNVSTAAVAFPLPSPTDSHQLGHSPCILARFSIKKRTVLGILSLQLSFSHLTSFPFPLPVSSFSASAFPCSYFSNFPIPLKQCEGKFGPATGRFAGSKQKEAASDRGF